MTELLTRMLADTANLLQHCFFWKVQDHSCSCLLCWMHTQNVTSSPTKQVMLITPSTSSDLQLLHSGMGDAIRFLKIAKKNDYELQFWYQLHHYLGYQDNYLCIDPQFDVVVICNQDKLAEELGKELTLYQHAKQIVILSSVRQKFVERNIVCVFYYDFEVLLKIMIHLLFLTKHRVCIGDIAHYFPYISVDTIIDSSTCLFL